MATIAAFTIPTELFPLGNVHLGVGIAQTNYFFAGWEPIVRIVIAGTAMYISLLIFLRLSGSRTIASMTVFDFVVTVAIGAAFGGSLTAKAIPLAEAVTAFGLLVGLQYAVAWIGARWPRFRRRVTNRPALLYFRGEFSQETMRDARLTEAELRATVRKRGIGSMDDVEAIILESAGDVSVITSVGDGSALPENASDRVS
jgi:uncharacterized membrane protein YcaP (DUF421 family)